ncbi:LysM domain receptor-like kinase 4 [Abeliophyllum distichum]|uniref:LysM domain receptor-like kinase 4 n=1 Tax=Abeliophyllum distichum TaxID=126358 RepID=A0ABD1RVP5_9LAMI
MPTFLYLCILILLIKPTFPQQHYDHSNCTSEIQYPGSNYLCNAKKSSCETFIVYRAQNGYQTLSSIASLFNTNTSHLLLYNNMSQTDLNNIQPGREIIMPVTCSCADRFTEAFFLYNASMPESLSAIACEVFEGLVKAQSLIDNNQEFQGDRQNLSLIEVPVKCACPDTSDARNGTNFLVTYPVISTDSIDLIARKFGVPQEIISDANRLEHFDTIFPQTTLLIPTKDVPILYLDVLSSPPDPNSSGILILARKKFDRHRCNNSSRQTSKFSDLSPDFLDDISKLKLTLTCYSLEELRVATKDFNEAFAIGSAVYRGRTGNTDVAIEQINSTEEANRVISILTKINHINVVKLEGCCFESSQYLVYEFGKNGSLRDCLSHSRIAKQLTWDKRIQIAVDITVGLHYIHYCTRPNYVHWNINSKSILITENWRAKISGFRRARSRSCSEEKRGNYEKDTTVDVFAFGMILLELLSGKQITANGMSLKDFLKVFCDKELQESSKSLEELKTFMDPVMEKDYPLEGAVFLAHLAKCCLEEDPFERPSMNDVLKALSSTF